MKAEANVLIYTVFNFFSKAISSILILVIAYFLTTAEIGKITLFISLFSICSLIFGLSLYGAGSSYTYRLEHESNINLFWGNLFLLVHIVILLYCIVFGFVWLVDAKLFANIGSGFGLIILLFLSSGAVVFNLMQTYLQTLGLSKIYARNGIVYSFLNFICIIIFALFSANHFYGYLFGWSVAIGIMYVYAIFFFLKKFTIKFNLKNSKLSLAYSLPLVVHSSFGLIITYVDRLYVDHYMSSHALGLYGLTSQIALLSNILLNGFNMSYVPFCYKVFQDKSNIQTIQNLCDRFFVLIMFLLLIAFALLKYFFVFIMPSQYISCWPLMMILLFSYFVYMLYYFYSAAIFYKKSNYILFCTVPSGMLVLLINYLLIPKIGLYGAALSFFCGFCGCAILAYIIARIKSGFQLPVNKYIFSYLIFLVLIVPIVSVNLLNFSLIYSVVATGVYLLISCAVLQVWSKYIFKLGMLEAIKYFVNK